MIALEDLKDYTEEQVIEHLTREYGEGDGSSLEGKEVMVAYESVGSWGCDSNSFFLLKDKETGELFEIHGSHCSCYGFEGQLQLEPTTVEALKFRNKDNQDVFYTGGYDNNGAENKKVVKEFIESL